MSKDKISDYSTTANSNTDIGGINVDEGCAPSGINDAIRTLMAQLKTWQSGGQDVYIHPAGSASAPSITANGDTNTGIFFPAADTVGISTGGTERARVDSSGNLGLGVTPSAWSGFKAIDLQGGGAIASYTASPSIQAVNNAYFDGTNWRYKTSTYASRYIQDSGAHSWYYTASGTAGQIPSFTQAMTLDASGNLGVGTTSPSSFNAAGSGIANVFGTGSNASTLAIYSGTSSSGYFYFADGTSGTDRYRGYIEYAHADDSFRFGTASTERARIDSSGVLMVNTTTRFANSYLSVYNASDNAFMARVGDNTKATIGGLNASSSLTFYVLGSGQIYSTSTSITAISDRSQKANIQEIPYGLSTIQNLQPVKFDFKDGCGSEEKGLLGFIAQDVEQVIPELVKTNTDDLKTLKMGDMLPVLVKAIQELKESLDSVKAEFDAYKASHP